MSKENLQIKQEQPLASPDSVKKEGEISEQFNSGHWNEQENFLYMVFIDVHKAKFKYRNPNKYAFKYVGG